MCVGVVESPDVRTKARVAAAGSVELTFALAADDAGAIERAAGEIYRRVRHGDRVTVKVVGDEGAARALAAACDAVGFNAAISVGTDDVCAPNTKFVETAVPDRPLKVAIAGLGVVGGGAALRVLREPGRYELVGALVRDPAKPREPALQSVAAVTTIEGLLALGPDVVIDALSSGEAGRALTEAALQQGVHIVSANKQAIAGALDPLHAIARRGGARFHYSASVGGGAPIIETVHRAGGDPIRIEAILNGTVNFILSGLQQGAAFDGAVRAAQAAGFAEEDPSADLSGHDAAAKAAILIREAYGADFDPAAVTTTALTANLYAKCLREGGVFRQVTRIERLPSGEITAGVDIVAVEPDSSLGLTVGEGNGVSIETVTGVIAASGRGAGRIPTVESVLADLAEILRA